MRSSRPRHILLTGPPGSGKSTVLSAALSLLKASGRQVFGFWTPEIRRGRAREGFAVELLSGRREVLASRDFPGSPRVGRYGVRLEAMDQLVVPEIQRAMTAAAGPSGGVIILDEIGKMELYSAAFRGAVLAALESDARVLATIMARPHPFADQVKRRPDVVLWTVTRENRDDLPQQVAEILLSR